MDTNWQDPDRIDAETLARTHAPKTHPSFDRVVRTIWRLRQADGCPWDREQTHASIATNMIEEAYEAKEAISQNSREHLIEEMGDVLEQVLLHSQIAADEHSFDIDTVAQALNTKLISRHPHVFGNKSAASGEEALATWDAVKKQERKTTQGLLDSIPQSLPALMQCQKISTRAAKAGFEWTTTQEVWDKVAEERAEFEAEAPGSPERSREFGDMLFALVNVARHEGIDAEEALAEANKKFRRRWSAMETAAQNCGVSLADLDTNKLNTLWEHVKIKEG